MVFPVPYRHGNISNKAEQTIIDVGKGIRERFDIYFVETGADENHIHFLIQSVPKISVEVIVRIVKSIMAKEIFKIHPEVKQILWGDKFWASGHYTNTVGRYGNEEVIKRSLREQGT